VKDTIKRKQPQFNEEYHGTTARPPARGRAAARRLIKLRKGERSGPWVIDDVLEDGA
jgi:hypothetical protein